MASQYIITKLASDSITKLNFPKKGTATHFKLVITKQHKHHLSFDYIFHTFPTSRYIILHNMHPKHHMTFLTHCLHHAASSNIMCITCITHHSMHQIASHDIFDTLSTTCYNMLHHMHPMHHTASYDILDTLPTTCYIICIPCIT